MGTVSTDVAWNVLGQRVRCLLDGDKTRGTMSVFLIEAPAGAGVPAHTHSIEDEGFVVLEGEIEGTRRGKAFRLRAGEALYSASGEEHSFRNPGPGEARLLVITRPAGFERFFAEMDREVGSQGGEPDMALASRIIAKYGMKLSGEGGGASE